MANRDDADMAVTVNGALRRVPHGTSVAALVTLLELRPDLVAIEVAGVLVPKTRRAERLLAEGDAIEIVTLVGGG